MFCQSSNPKGNGFVPCDNKATDILWCPTWTTAGRGPQAICVEHAKNFKPEFNKHAKDGEFYWGDAAHEAYKRIGVTRATTFPW